MQMALEDPKRFRVEMTFSRGADLSPLEVTLRLIFIRTNTIHYRASQYMFSLVPLCLQEVLEIIEPGMAL